MCFYVTNVIIEPPFYSHQPNYPFHFHSTGMESAIILSLFKRSVIQYGLKYHKFVGDGDSNTEHLLSSTPVYNDVVIRKIECKNHLIRNFAKHLDITLTKNVPAKQRQPLLNVIHKITVAMHFVVKNNSTKDPQRIEPEKELKSDILNVIHHYCGYHDNCGEKCVKENKPLCNRSILALLEETTQRKLCRHSSSLLEALDSNAVEQFHSIVAMFVGGKRINFSLSWGYAHRYFAAVLHFNENDFMSYYLRHVMSEEPNQYLQKTVRYRSKQKLAALLSSTKVSKKRCLKRTSKKKGLEYYGLQSKKPDMETEQLIESKLLLVEQLKHDQLDRDKIEFDTRDQRTSDLWLLKRRNLLTASNFGYVINSKEDTLQNKISQFRATFKTTPEMELGIEMESLGVGRAKTEIENLKSIKDIVICPGGLFIDKSLYFLGASPDGVYDNMVIEIKTASAAWNDSIQMGIQDKKIKCLSFNKSSFSPLQLKRNHAYYYQVQGQLHICEKESCAFLIQTSNDYFFEVIHKDDKFWKNKMEKRLRDFWEFMTIELIDPRKERSMDIRKYKDYKEFSESPQWRIN